MTKPPGPRHWSRRKTPEWIKALAAQRGVRIDSATCIELFLPEVEFIMRNCRERWLVTLTSRRRYDTIQLTAEVSKVIHFVNCQIYRRRYLRDGMRLVMFAVHEYTIDRQLHVHILVGCQDGSLESKAIPFRGSIPELITETWMAADRRTRSSKGQDGRDVHHFAGACEYLFKDVKSLSDVDHFDVLNTYIPR